MSSLGFACSLSSLEVADYSSSSSSSLLPVSGHLVFPGCTCSFRAVPVGLVDHLRGTSPHLIVSALNRGVVVKSSRNTNNGQGLPNWLTLSSLPGSFCYCSSAGETVAFNSAVLSLPHRGLPATPGTGCWGQEASTSPLHCGE